MAEYIAKDDLLAHLYSIQDEKADIMLEIANFPPIDVIHVVMCRECVNYCKYEEWDRYRQESFECHECTRLKTDLGADGYCSFGEKISREGTP